LTILAHGVSSTVSSTWVSAVLSFWELGPYGNKETGVSSMALFHWLKMHGGDSWMN